MFRRLRHDLQLIEMAASYDAVIFDLDGTLLDSNAVAPRCVNHTLAHFGLAERPPDSLQWCANWRSEVLWTELLPSDRSHMVNGCADFYRTTYREVLLSVGPLFDGTLAVLEALRSAGVAAAILSNREHEDVRQLANVTGLDAFVSIVGGLSNAAEAKPSATSAETTLAPLFRRIPRHRILMCGDSSVDILFARNASIASCWASYGYGVPDECLSLCPDYIIKTIDGLSTVVLDIEE